MKKVERIEVKRAFVLSQRFTSKKMRKENIKVHMPSKKTLHDNLSREKKRVVKMSEKALDCIIEREYPQRLRTYNHLEWYIGDVFIDKVKVWRKTGGLYVSWTDACSLDVTARKLSVELQKDRSKIARRRAMQVIPQIVASKDFLQSEKSLMPIVVPNGIYKKHHGGIRTVPWFLDDGCMRSLAYAVSGDKKLKVFIGKHPNKSI